MYTDSFTDYLKNDKKATNKVPLTHFLTQVPTS